MNMEFLFKLLVFHSLCSAKISEGLALSVCGQAVTGDSSKCYVNNTNSGNTIVPCMLLQSMHTGVALKLMDVCLVRVPGRLFL